ncbi:MAG: lactonase family protein, partial [Planctomycetota bacterium]|nr:lactonase family protein [Planctomycetota bacterium]
MRYRHLFLSLVFAFSTAHGFLSADELRFFVGTYTQGDSQGIYTATLDTQTGKVTKPKLVAKTENPSFLAVHPTNRFLYSVGEVSNFGGKESGSIDAFSIGKAGQLTLINQQASQGGAPCHLVVDAKGKFVLFANYFGGNVGTMPIAKDGSLGTASGFAQHKGSSVTPRQKGPHAHSINLDKKNRFAVAADLGLDQLITYRLGPKGALKRVAEHDEKPGAGPRHFCFHPNGKLGFLLNEISATISSLAYDGKTGKFTPIQTLSTLPTDFDGRKSCAEVRVHPSGKFLYCSNRGHDSIAVYTIAKTGTMEPIEIVKTGGEEPRNFTLDPT